jgi:hypothetical protein
MEKRVDDDEAGARLDHPRVVSQVADPIEVVEDLARLLIPLGTWRHDFLARRRGCGGQPIDAAGAPAPAAASPPVGGTMQTRARSPG